MQRILIFLLLGLLLLPPVLTAAATPAPASEARPVALLAGKHTHNRGGDQVGAERKQKNKNKNKKNKNRKKKISCFAQRATLFALGTERLEGTTGDDVIFGDDAANSVQGNGGVDRVCLGAGDDFVVGSLSVVIADALLVKGGPGDDFLSTANGDDVVFGEDGVDSISGGGGNNRLDGGNGNDDLFAFAGNDEIAGGPGNDRLSGFDGSDRLDGGPGDDLIFGLPDEGDPAPEGVDTALGGDGNDTIRTNDGVRAVVDCGPGNDTVTFDAGLDEVANCEIQNPAN